MEMIRDTLQEGEGEMDYVHDGYIFIIILYILVLDTFSKSLV